MHRRIENNLKAIAAFDREHRGRGNEARTVAVRGIAAFIVSTSTEAELKLLLDRVEPFSRRMWWRSKMKGKRLASGEVYGEPLRITARNFHTRAAQAELDRLIQGKV